MKETVVLSPSKSENNHIQSVRLMTGPDDYAVSSAVDCSTKDGQIVIKTVADLPKAAGRYRGELAIEVNLASEDGEEWILKLWHHKGSVYAESEALRKVEPEREMTMRRVERFLIDADPEAVFTFTEVARAIGSHCRAVGKCMTALYHEGKLELCAKVRYKKVGRPNPWLEECEMA